MNYDYLYSYNKERYRHLAERELPVKEQFATQEVEHGYLLPAKAVPKRLFGLGGVLDQDKNYVDASAMTAFAKYATYPHDTDCEIYLGKEYEIIEPGDELDETVVYLGYLSNHWGHFLIDCSTRLYFFLENKQQENLRYAFLVDEHAAHTMIPNIHRFFELLGLNPDSILLINEVTKCRKIMIPEPAYQINSYISKEFLSVFDQVAQNAMMANNKPEEQHRAEELSLAEDTAKRAAGIYFTRSQFAKAQNSEIGEEILLDMFRKNNFQIVSPEKETLDQQICLIRRAKVVAGMIGTIAHNMLFASQGQKLILVNKTYNLNVAQMDFNLMRKLDVTYLDAYLAPYPVDIGNGPFILTYSSELNHFIEDNTWKKPEEALVGDAALKKDVKTFEKRFRSKHRTTESFSYETDEKRYDYYPPGHLADFYQKCYFLQKPITWQEKLAGQIQRVKGFLARMR